MSYDTMTARHEFWLALLSASLWSGGGGHAQTVAPNEQELVRVRVSDPAMTRAIEAAGGRPVADYGSFAVLECDAASAGSLVGLDGVELLGDDSKILLRAGTIDTSTQAQALAPQVADTDAGKTLRLIQFAAPVLPAWYDALVGTGAEVLTYVPNNAYLVYADAQARTNLRALASSSGFVRWEGSYSSDNRIFTRGASAQTQVQVQGQAQSEELFTIQLVDDPVANPFTLALIDARRTGSIKLLYPLLNYRNIVVGLSEQDLAELAGRPDVVFIEPYAAPVMCDEAQDIIVAGLISGHAPAGPGYLQWLESLGFTQEQFDASGFVVDVTDSGIDNGTQQPNHFGLYVDGVRPGTSRIAYNRIEGNSQEGTLAGCDGHGTIDAHIIGGYNDLNGFPYQDARGFRYGLGVAPYVRIGSSVVFTPSYTFPAHPDLVSRAYRDGARISSNSWGYSFSWQYDAEAQIYDFLVRDAQPTGAAVAQPGNQEMVIVFAAGNMGPAHGSIISPGTAKNVITVGASENVRPVGGTDNCRMDDPLADSADDVTPFSSRGATPDGRLKPDIVAPGTHVTGGVFQIADYGPLGEADPCFNASMVCGGTAGSRFFPAGQQLYTTSSGTSQACPAVAGGAALIRQFFLNQGWSAPSPAMTKCILTNSARYLTGTFANDTLPSPNQGMGGMDLHEVFARGTTVPSLLRDQLAEDAFAGTGSTRVFLGAVADSAKPLRVTLAWTDAPGSPIGAVQRNDLDLAVSVGGSIYKGNVFAGPTSIAGGQADRFNNVESVFLPGGMTGPVTIVVTAANINSDGVPGVGGFLDQDFALVAYNVSASGSVAITATDWNLTTESCLPANGLPDPDETLTLAVSLRNIGTIDAGNIIAKLMADDGIELLADQATYGPLAAGGLPGTQQFSFKVRPPCGEDLRLVLMLWDQPNSLGTIQLLVPAGGNQAVFAEAFDSVTPPALPVGWTTPADLGISAEWRSSGDQADSPPGAAFAAETGVLSASTLTSPPIHIDSASAKLSFRHRYNLHAGSGGQLLIAVAGSDPMDVLDLGGVCVEGPYTGLLVTAGGSRWSWTGDSGGWITTTVRLPGHLAGQTVQLQWLVNSGGINGGGWYVDTISISDRGSCCASPSVAQVNGPSIQSTREGPVEYTVLFSEPVVGFDSADDIEIQATGPVAVGAVTITGSGAGPYQINLSQLMGRGTLGISVREHACTDVDGNGNSGSGPSALVVVDNAPVGCTVTRLDPDPTGASAVRFKVSFSKPVIGFTLEDLEISSSVTRAATATLQADGSDYEVGITNIVGNGTVCLGILTAAVQDEMGNTNLAVEPVCYTIAQVQPTTWFDYQLVATRTPCASNHGVLPPSLFEVSAGEPFALELWARQVNRDDSGLTCVYANMGYEPEKLGFTSQAPDVRFAQPLFQEVNGSAPGLVAGLGGCTLERPLNETNGLTSNWVRVAQVAMKAQPVPCAGRDCPPITTWITLGPAAGESAAYGEGMVDSSAILYGSLELRVHPGAPPDIDQDGDVDLADLALLQQCASGPSIPFMAGCDRMDLDADGDVDQNDFGVFQRCYAGTDIAPVPACAN